MLLKKHVCSSHLWLSVICWWFVSPVPNDPERPALLSVDFLVGLYLLYVETQSLKKTQSKRLWFSYEPRLTIEQFQSPKYYFTVFPLGLFFFKFFYFLNDLLFLPLLLLNLGFRFRNCLLFLFQWCLLQLQIWEINEHVVRVQQLFALHIQYIDSGGSWYRRCGQVHRAQSV